MADTINHFRAVFRGDYLQTLTQLADEEWSTGLSLYAQLSAVPDIGTPDGSFEAADALLSYTDANGTYESNYLAEGGATDLDPATYLRDQVRAAFVTFMGAGGSASFQATRLTSIVLYPMKIVSGRAKVCTTSYGPAKAVFTPATPPAGPGTSLIPAQNSVVLSLRTANATRKGRGRMYLPGLGNGGLDTSGMVNPTARGNVATAGAALMAAVQYTQGVGPALEIAPVVIGQAGATFFKVKRCSVGSVVDAQRRRRLQLTEVYANADVTY